MSNDQGSSGSVMLAFAIGALAGAAIALLYAPATGEETRDDVGRNREPGARQLRGRHIGHDRLAVDQHAVAVKDEHGWSPIRPLLRQPLPSCLM